MIDGWDGTNPVLDVVSTDKLLHDLMERLRPQLEREGTRLRLETRAPFPGSFRSNWFLLRRILLHVLGGEIEYTPAGRVHVVVRYVRTSDGKRVVFDIQGRGEAIALRGMIGGRLERPEPGTGMELARRIARALGGDVSVLESKMVGSHFSVSVQDRSVGSERIDPIEISLDYPPSA